MSVSDPPTFEVRHAGSVVPLKPGSLDFQRVIQDRGQLRFEWHVAGSFPDPPGKLVRGDEVEVYLDPDSANTKIWGGLVNRTVERSATAADPAERTIEYEVVSYEKYADRRRAAETYSNATAGSIVEDLRSTYLADFGVTGSGVEIGPTVESATFNYRTVKWALDRLSELTGYHWRITLQKDLEFFERASKSVVLSIDANSQPFRTIDVTRHLEEYRNKQIVRGGKELTTQRTETPATDGETKTFQLAYPVGTEPTVKVNAQSQTVGVQDVDSGKDFYWQKGRDTVVQDDGASPLSASDSLEVTYEGLVPVIVVSQDTDAISERQGIEGGSGVYEHMETDKSLETRDEALDLSDSLLRRYAKVSTEVALQVQGSGTLATIEPGDLVEIDLPVYDLDGTFLVTEISGRDVGDFSLEMDLTLLSGEAVGGWRNFFRRLKEAGQDFVIRENEVLVLMRRSADEQGVSDSLSVAQAQQIEPTDENGIGDSLAVTALAVFEVGSSSIESSDVIG